MNIQPVVEGLAEVQAVPILLRRLLHEAAQVFDHDVNRPILQHRSDFPVEPKLRKMIALARRQANCGAILIMFDADEDCPAALAPHVLQWAQSEAGRLPVAVAMPCRKFESWFLGTIESLRGKCGIRSDAQAWSEPETIVGCEAHLERVMADGHRRYVKTFDQPKLTAAFDMAMAYRSCRSFRHLVTAFGQLVNAMGADLQHWPPPAW